MSCLLTLRDHLVGYMDVRFDPVGPLVYGKLLKFETAVWCLHIICHSNHTTILHLLAGTNIEHLSQKTLHSIFAANKILKQINNNTVFHIFIFPAQGSLL